MAQKEKKISEDMEGKESIKANYQNHQKVESIPSPSFLLLLIDLAFHYFLFELLYKLHIRKTSFLYSSELAFRDGS